MSGITRVTSSPISDERYQIELPGGRFSALVDRKSVV